MFKSIKTKIIVTVTLLFLVGVAAMTSISGAKVKQQTEDSLIDQSVVLVNEIRHSIQYFFSQYEKGLMQLSTSRPVTDFVIDGNEVDADEAKQLREALDAELGNALELYDDALTVYYSHPDRHVNMPYNDLGADYDPTQRPWYQNALENPDEVHWTSPYINAGNGQLVITASKVVHKEGAFDGVIAIDIELSTLMNNVSQTKLSHGGYPMILDAAGIAIVHPTSPGENMEAFDFIENMYSGSEEGVIHYAHEGFNRVNIFTTIPELGWKISTVYDENNIIETATALQNSMYLVAFITLVLFIIVLYVSISRFIRPLHLLNGHMDGVAQGDLTVRSDIHSKDEIGALSANFNTMIESMNNLIGVVKASASDVRNSSESLSAVAEETNASSEEVAHAVNEIAQGASRSAEDAETVTERSEILGRQIGDINEKAVVMTDIAKKAEEMNQSGQQQMQTLLTSFVDSVKNIQEMVKVFAALEEKIGEIGSVMDAITGISAQTNLLALNASIEAARAGEHGKGFAVVAEEVRKLAEQSARSTDEVQETIREIQAESRQVSEEMTSASEIFGNQAAVIHATDRTFNDISALMVEMMESIDAVANEIGAVATLKEDVSETIQTMTATSQETAAACEEVSASTDEQLHAIQSVTKAAEALTALSEELNRTVNRFTV